SYTAFTFNVIVAVSTRPVSLTMISIVPCRCTNMSPRAGIAWRRTIGGTTLASSQLEIRGAAGRSRGHARRDLGVGQMIGRQRRDNRLDGTRGFVHAPER